MKIESLIAHLTPVGSPAKAKYDVLVMNLDVSWPVQAIFVVKGSVVM